MVPKCARSTLGLNLWGPGTPFGDFKTFADTLDKRGVGALELLALELKSSGAYVSRGLSWGKCEFEDLPCPLGGAAIADYDAMAAWWRATRRALDHAGRRAGIASTFFRRRGAASTAAPPRRAAARSV